MKEVVELARALREEGEWRATTKVLNGLMMSEYVSHNGKMTVTYKSRVINFTIKHKRTSPGVYHVWLDNFDNIIKDIDYKLSTCDYNIPYGGRCNRPNKVTNGKCEEHANLKCHKCDNDATHGCCDTFSLGVCGLPLCDNCKCN